jgi:pSer/pThr/pTyr-binding forkhead associated (FHA) protein
LKQSPAEARAIIGAEHVLVPLEPWEIDQGEETPTPLATIGAGHRVDTAAGKKVPSLATGCFPLPEAGPLTVGRLSGAGVPIRQPTVSRFHAQINCINGVFSVRDTGSYNGTVVNNRVLEQGEALALTNGDVVIFGEAQLVFGDLDSLAALI